MGGGMDGRMDGRMGECLGMVRVEGWIEKRMDS